MSREQLWILSTLTTSAVIAGMPGCGSEDVVGTGGSRGTGGSDGSSESISAGAGGQDGMGGADGSGGSSGSSESIPAGTGGQGGIGVSSKCPVPDASCTDIGPGEPNNSLPTAYSLGHISDADFDGSRLCATLSGPSDVDWYTYHGSDYLLSIVDPWAKIDSSRRLRLCSYFQCRVGSPHFTCPFPSTPDTGPSGAPGCCSDSQFALPHFYCTTQIGGDDSAQVWIRVDNPGSLACAAYELRYHF